MGLRSMIFGLLNSQVITDKEKVPAGIGKCRPFSTQLFKHNSGANSCRMSWVRARPRQKWVRSMQASVGIEGSGRKV